MNELSKATTAVERAKRKADMEELKHRRKILAALWAARNDPNFKLRIEYRRKK